eukprot:1134502-Pelagomonas_calceolata.AAC.2
MSMKSKLGLYDREFHGKASSEQALCRASFHPVQSHPRTVHSTHPDCLSISATHPDCLSISATGLPLDDEGADALGVAMWDDPDQGAAPEAPDTDVCCSFWPAEGLDGCKDGSKGP